MSATKRVLFVCGSPRRDRSASRATAEYLARFLDHDFEFLDLASVRISAEPTEVDVAFQGVLDRLRAANAVVWTFGAWTHFVPLDLQLLFEKLFEQGVLFDGKLAAAVMTSVHVHDDAILKRVRFVSEQLGFGYLGDVSATGNPFFGYTGDEATAESSCRVLAGQIARALADGYVPARISPPLERECLAPSARGSGFPVGGPATKKNGKATLLMITGNRLDADPASASVAEAIRRFSRNTVEVIELEARRVGKCVGCLQCDLRSEGTCVIPDEYESIKQRMHEVDGIILVGTCAGGMVERRLKAFLDRTFGLAHRPTLGGKYGFAVATGGGSLEPEVTGVLHGLLGARGVCSLAALATSSDLPRFVATLRRTVEDLDRAIDERWSIPDRFGVRASHEVYRRLAHESGHALRADYQYYRARSRMTFGLSSIGRAFLRLLFRSRTMERRLMAMERSALGRKRAQRLAIYLAAGGRLGRGRDRGTSAYWEGNHGPDSR
jgi:hypothetical protein